VGRGPFDDGALRAFREAGRRNMEVDAPARVVVEGATAVGPPRVRAVDTRVQAADHVDPAGAVQLRQPCPLVGQEPRVLDVAAPVADVGLGVGDVPVAADEHLAVLGGRLLPAQRQIGAQRREEAVLLVLARGADGAVGQVQRRDRDAREVDLDVSARVGPLGRVDADAHGLGLRPGEHGDPGPALGRVARSEGQVPAVHVEGGQQCVGQVLVAGARLLQADDVGFGGGQPRGESLGARSADTVDVDGTDREHGRRLADRSRGPEQRVSSSSRPSWRGWSRAPNGSPR